MKRILFLLGCLLFNIIAFAQSGTTETINNKIASTALVAKVSALQSDITINPNPVTGENFTLELQNLDEGKYYIYIYDKKGKKYLIKTFSFEGGSITEKLNLPEEAGSGTYILQVVSKTQRFSKKMIIE